MKSTGDRAVEAVCVVEVGAYLELPSDSVA
jgi:hypothetical protein